MLGAVAWVALGGCLDAGVEPDDGEDTVEQGLTSSLYDSRSFGGYIFSQTFNYTTPRNCGSGFVRQSASTRWTSQLGGHCAFTGWASSMPSDCGATVQAVTAGDWFGGTCETFITEISGGWYPYDASNTNSAQQNTVNVQIFVTAGQTLTLGTCGVMDATAQGDTFLRLIRSDGLQVAMNDDACGGRGSMLTYVATFSDIYTVHAGCYSSGSCSGQMVWNLN
jgi:hypothetical protein